MVTKPANKITIGITGGIGSGKSTICKIFECLGYPVYYADESAKHLMNTNGEIIGQIELIFGKDAYWANGELNKVYLANAVFGDDTKLKLLNAIVHPAVNTHFQNWIEAQTSKVLFKEAALLFETKSYTKLDHTVLVVSPLELRVNRIMNRDKHRTKADIIEIIERQMSDADKMKFTQLVIHNNESDSLILQCLHLLNSLVDVKYQQGV